MQYKENISAKCMQMPLCIGLKTLRPETHLLYSPRGCLVSKLQLAQVCADRIIPWIYPPAITKENKETTPAGNTFPDSMYRDPMINNRRPEIPARWKKPNFFITVPTLLSWRHWNGGENRSHSSISELGGNFETQGNWRFFEFWSFPEFWNFPKFWERIVTPPSSGDDGGTINWLGENYGQHVGSQKVTLCINGIFVVDITF